MKWGIGILAIILAVVLSWYLLIPKIDDNAPPSLTKIDSSTASGQTVTMDGVVSDVSGAGVY